MQFHRLGWQAEVTTMNFDKMEMVVAACVSYHFNTNWFWFFMGSTVGVDHIHHSYNYSKWFVNEKGQYDTQLLVFIVHFKEFIVSSFVECTPCSDRCLWLYTFVELCSRTGTAYTRSLWVCTITSNDHCFERNQTEQATTRKGFYHISVFFPCMYNFAWFHIDSYLFSRPEDSKLINFFYSSWIDFFNWKWCSIHWCLQILSVINANCHN